jgi:hypothetical protein
MEGCVPPPRQEIRQMAGVVGLDYLQICGMVSDETIICESR